MYGEGTLLHDYMTSDELADGLGRSKRTTDRWRRLGIGPPWTRIGRRVLYRRAAVREWIASHETVPVAEAERPAPARRHTPAA